MPYAETTRPYASTSQYDALMAVFTYPWFRAIQHPAFAHTVPHMPGVRGRRSQYPPLLQFLVLTLSRAYRSQNAALEHLNKNGLWQEACDLYRALVRQNINLPSAPPTAEQMDAYLRRHFGVGAPVCMRKPEAARVASATTNPACKPGWEVRTLWEPNVDALRLLRDGLTRTALNQAQKQGLLPRDVDDVDFANPDDRFLFYGDGTWLGPYSKATRIRVGDDDYLVVGSRAKKGRHRIPDRCRKGTVDEKEVIGINNIFIAMWTDAGRVVVMADQTTGSETPKAMAMLRHLITYIPGRVRTVVWDKALSGKELHDLMAKDRTMVLTKPVARAKDSTYSDGYRARALGESEAVAMHDRQEALPLGTSIVREDGNKKMVRSKFHRLFHTAEEVANCPRDHDLWVDGNSLWETYLDPSDTHRYKSRPARCVSAIPRRAEAMFHEECGELTEVVMDWELACDQADDGIHRFTFIYRPYDLASGRPVGGLQRALHDLRPVGTADERFWETYNTRNNAEGLNATYKRTLANKDHAMRLRAHEQEVDQIAMAFLINAKTWHVHRQQTRDSVPAAPLGATSRVTPTAPRD